MSHTQTALHTDDDISTDTEHTRILLSKMVSPIMTATCTCTTVVCTCSRTGRAVVIMLESLMGQLGWSLNLHETDPESSERWKSLACFSTHFNIHRSSIQRFMQICLHSGGSTCLTPLSIVHACSDSVIHKSFSVVTPLFL